MIRLFAYLNFTLVLSTALILSSNAFILRTYDGILWIGAVAFSTGFLYFLLSRKLMTRYLKKAAAFANSEWVMTAFFALPPVAWISVNFGLTNLGPSLVLIFIIISLILSTYLSAYRQSPTPTSENPPQIS